MKKIIIICTLLGAAISASAQVQLSSSLEGRIGGLLVQQGSGEPGTGASLWIRGVRTTGADSSPLIIVDGAESEIDLIDPEEILSIELLKDAAATTLYGIRGNNGVIVITTKRGYDSEPKVAFSAKFGIGTATRLPQVANTQQWMDWYNSIYTAQGLEAPFTQELQSKYISGTDPDAYPSVNWMNEVFTRPSTNQKYGVSVTGGTNKVHYYAYGSYLNETGCMNQLGYSRFNIRTNVDVNITSTLLLNLSLATQFSTTTAPVTDMETIMSDLVTTTPIAVAPVFSDGSISMPQNINGSNPYNDVNSYGNRKDAGVTAQTRLKLTQDLTSLTKGLSVGLAFNYDVSNGNSLYRYLNPVTYYIDQQTPRNQDGSLNLHSANDASGYSSLSKTINGYTTIDANLFANYKRTFSNKHEVSAVILADLYNKYDNVPSTYIESYAYRYLTFAAQAGWVYDGKLSVQAGVSYSGSNNFSAEHRFGLYPNVALGYKISEALTIKAAYGLSGSEQLGNTARRFAFNSTLDTSCGGAIFGQTGTNQPTGIANAYYGDSTVGMEQSRKADISLEGSILGKLQYSAVVYADIRSGIFVADNTTPRIAGRGTQYVNLGGTASYGFEVSGSWTEIFANGLRIKLDGNFNFNTSRITADGLTTQKYDYQQYIGHRPGQQYGLIAEGLDADGNLIYQDYNNDGKVDSYDIVAIGYSTIPEIYYGFGAEASWKAWDASIRFNGTANVTRILSGTPINEMASDVLTGGQIFPGIERPAMTLSGISWNSQESTWWQKDMSYARLSDIELGYSFKNGIRVYVNGHNLLTLSKFRLWDPELDCSYGNAYPIMKTVTLGANIKF